MQHAALPSASFTSASLYVGDLAPEVSEGKLFDIFNSVGPVASIRVCRDTMLKRSLGYAYVNFHNQSDAERALETMNYTMIANRPCRIMWSQRDPSLRKSGVGNIFVKSLHPDVHHKELQDTFSLFGDILSCKVALDPEGKSKGYGYVHFAGEDGAKKAIEMLDEIEICGQKVEVLPFQKKDAATRQTAWTNLYVKNVPTHLSEEDIKAMFAEAGNVTSLKLAVSPPHLNHRAPTPTPTRALLLFLFSFSFSVPEPTAILSFRLFVSIGLLTTLSLPFFSLPS